jgi:hypothetical protein
VALHLARSNRAQRVFVIAKHWIKPGFIEQVDCCQLIAAAVNQIAHGEKAITRTIESNLAKQITQCVDAAVQIANHEVTANFVRRMPANDRMSRGSHSNNLNLTKCTVMRANSLCNKLPTHILERPSLMRNTISLARQ